MGGVSGGDIEYPSPVLRLEVTVRVFFPHRFFFQIRFRDTKDQNRVNYTPDLPFDLATQILPRYRVLQFTTLIEVVLQFSTLIEVVLQFRYSQRCLPGLGRSSYFQTCGSDELSPNTRKFLFISLVSFIVMLGSVRPRRIYTRERELLLD